jgi:hypothetical protein
LEENTLPICWSKTSWDEMCRTPGKPTSRPMSHLSERKSDIWFHRSGSESGY